MRAGGVNLLIPNPRDMAGFIKELSEIPGQQLPGGQHALQRLLPTPRLRQGRLLQAEDVGRRRHGGAEGPVAELWLKKSPAARCRGLRPVGDLADADLQPRRHDEPSPARSAFPCPRPTSIRDDDGNEVPLGEPGEICAKGPQVMAGYWNRPDETAKVMTADGYFRTGDIGVMTTATATPRSSTARRT
jgi:long-chain acyl-CoA synthetase